MFGRMGDGRGRQSGIIGRFQARRSCRKGLCSGHGRTRYHGTGVLPLSPWGSTHPCIPAPHLDKVHPGRRDCAAKARSPV
jgi:hypothetical protein